MIDFLEIKINSLDDTKYHPSFNNKLAEYDISKENNKDLIDKCQIELDDMKYLIQLRAESKGIEPDYNKSLIINLEELICFYKQKMKILKRKLNILKNKL
jgi:hypothetical protein